MADEIKVSVVVPTGGDVLRLEWVLAGLARQVGVGTRRFEVIVCGDLTEEALPAVTALVEKYAAEVPHLRFVCLPTKTDDTIENYRPGSARNLGIVHATGAQIVFLDEDCVPDPDFVTAHFAQHGKVVIGYRRRLPLPRVVPFDGEMEDAAWAMYSETDNRLYRLDTEAVYPADWYTCNAGAPRELLLELGGFDTFFDGGLACEDINLACRMRDAKATFVRLQDAGWVTHLDHPARIRHDGEEQMGKCLRGEYPPVLPAGPLVAA